MARLVIFVSIFALLCSVALSEKDDDEYRIVDYSSNIYGAKLETNPGTNNVEKCELIHANGTVYSYQPANFENDYYRFQAGHYYECTMSVYQANERNVGRWIINEYIVKQEKPTVYKFILRKVEKKDFIEPINQITVYEGYYVTAAFMEKYNNITSCQLVTPKKERIDLGEYNGNEFERYGVCGIRMETNKNSTGAWQIEIVMNNYFVIYDVLDLTVVPKAEMEKIPDIHATRGKSVNIEIGSNTDYCILEDPSGYRLPLIIGKCKYNIPLVTKYHEGTWTARYGVSGMVEPAVVKFKVITENPSNVVTNIFYDQLSKSTEITCRFSTKSFQFCRFVRPNGTEYHYSPNIGIDGYEFFGNTTHSESRNPRTMYCGMKIRETKKEDFGAWKCYIQTNDETENQMGALIHIDSAITKSDYVKQAISSGSNDVIVKRGNDFKITCYANVILNYCWLKSPNGTTYSVVERDEKSKLLSTELRYSGAGLKLGECSAIVKEADDSHQGSWECYMGTYKGPEVSTLVSVSVSEYNFVADEISVNRSSNYVTLSCHMIPHIEDQAIDYCRWVDPNGHGIFNGIYLYDSFSNSSHCTLSFYFGESDRSGRWTCIAGLVGSKKEEVSAYVDFRVESYNYGAIIGSVVGGCLLVLLIVGTIFMMRVRLRKRSPIIDSSPRYVERMTFPTTAVIPVFMEKKLQNS